MSGIAALLNLDRRPVGDDELTSMIGPLLRRGPDRTGHWIGGEVGLGHTLLATTPEAAGEALPRARGALAITADARIDNRDELLSRLRPRGPAADISDAELILLGYERWGEDVVQHLLGDFAFALWDHRRRTLFCARDHFGVRPLYVHHAAHRLLAVASTPYAILALPGVSVRLDEGRIADFLVGQLEGIDKTSTFFDGIARVPPAHSLTVTDCGVRQRRYWELAAGPELVLGSDEEYDESFREVFDEAVRCRLRGGATTGSMLSGGLDSGAIVAVARKFTPQISGEPLATFSAALGTPNGCVESESIGHAMTMGGIRAHVVTPDDWGTLLPALQAALWNLDEPFDYHMNLQRAVYLAARQHGVKAVLDGIDADTVFSEGSQLARLLRHGRLREALGLARGLEAFWGDQISYSVGSQLRTAARAGLLPASIRSLGGFVLRREPKRLSGVLERSAISPDFAQRVHLAERLETLADQDPSATTGSAGEEAAAALSHPYLTVGVERYGRVASALGVEPRHPFLDRRLVAWSLTVPVRQKVADGWPKGIVRRALAGQLPDEVRWRRGKQHLGSQFTQALVDATALELRRELESSHELLEPYVRGDTLHRSLESARSSSTLEEDVIELAVLASWLRMTDTSKAGEGTT